MLVGYSDTYVTSRGDEIYVRDCARVELTGLVV